MRIKDYRKLLAFLEMKGFDEISHLEIESHWYGLGVTCSRNEITPEQFRELKAAFGPFTIKHEYGGKGFIGSRKIEPEMEVRCTISHAYACSELEEDAVLKMTDAQWEEYREKARAGLIRISSCEEVA